MDKGILKKVLLKGILIGLCFALAGVGLSTLVRGGAYFDSLLSFPGIATLVLFPAAWTAWLYNNEKNNKDK